MSIWLTNVCSHTCVFVCVCQTELCFWVCAVSAVFDFKAQQMKPKTGGKLTKHADPRWLMGRAEMTS